MASPRIPSTAGSNGSNSSVHSSSVCDPEDPERQPLNPDQIHAIMRSPTSSISSGRVDYMDTIGSTRPSSNRPEPARTTAIWMATNDLERGANFGDVVNVVSFERHSLDEGIDEERCKKIEQIALDIVAIHLFMMLFVHSTAHLLVVLYDKFCGNEAILRHVELAVVITFPVIGFVMFRVVKKHYDQSWLYSLLLGFYSIDYAVFLLSICDLVFGARSLTRYLTAFALLTLTVSLFTFNGLILAKEPSIRQRYYRLVALTFGVAVAIGMPAVVIYQFLPQSLKQLIQDAPTKAVPSGSWSPYSLVLLIALTCVLIVTILHFVLRRRYNRAVRLGTRLCALQSERERAIHVSLLSFGTITSIELFFIILPYEAAKRLYAKSKIHRYTSYLS